MRRKLGLMFLPHILDDINQRHQEAKIFRCGSLFQNVRKQDNREKKAHLRLNETFIKRTKKENRT